MAQRFQETDPEPASQASYAAWEAEHRIPEFTIRDPNPEPRTVYKPSKRSQRWLVDGSVYEERTSTYTKKLIYIELDRMLHWHPVK